MCCLTYCEKFNSFPFHNSISILPSSLSLSISLQYLCIFNVHLYLDVFLYSLLFYFFIFQCTFPSSFLAIISLSLQYFSFFNVHFHLVVSLYSLLFYLFYFQCTFPSSFLSLQYYHIFKFYSFLLTFLFCSLSLNQ